MVTEDYVSFETAKLLKEKGFDELCYTFYDCDSEEFYREERIPCCNSCSDDYASSTLQMAMKWLREVHNKHCDIGYDIDLKWFIQIIDLTESAEHNYPENGTGFKSYEEACEAAIKYCLENLI